MRNRFPTLCLAALLSAAALAFGAGAAGACGANTPCDTANGRYFVRTPAGWDGRTALPVAVFFHGYRNSAAETMADAALGDTLSKAGILLVAPDGLNGSWTIPGRLSTGRDDIAFAREVVADVAKRFPVDRARLIATGFSAGGFMVWQIACRAGDLFSAYAPISGAFLDPIPATCPTGPVSLRHVHGKADETVPMTGRWIAGGQVKQSDVNDSIARMRVVDQCAAQPTRIEREGELECRNWAPGDCRSGRALSFCLHAGGHTYDPAWIVGAFDWARALPAQGKAQSAAH